MYRLIYLSFCLFVLSCNSSDSNTDTINAEDTANTSLEDIMFNDLMQPNKGGMFRGFYFDMSRNEIRKTELSRPSATETNSEKENELIITSDLASELMDFADIKYTFDEKGMFHINVESYLETHEKANKIYNKLKSHFEKKHGQGFLAEDGFLEFTVKSDKYECLISIKEINYPPEEDKAGSYGFYMLYSMLE